VAFFEDPISKRIGISADEVIDSRRKVASIVRAKGAPDGRVVERRVAYSKRKTGCVFFFKKRNQKTFNRSVPWSKSCLLLFFKK
jgi:hypothetical protein